MPEPLLRIENRHTANCGDPPIVASDDKDAYIGYFENAFGEQWIFSFDRETRIGQLRGGDTGWNTTFDVRNGEVDKLMLNPAESMWLRACWSAATGT
jgi:hypothetical protein